MADQEEVAVDDIVTCVGPERIGGGAMVLTRPDGPKKVHRIMPSMIEGGDAWALLKEPGYPYVTATWPVSHMTKVSD